MSKGDGGVEIPVLYQGLAPGLAGVYQLDVQLPADAATVAYVLYCSSAGNSFYGQIPIGP